MFAIGCCYCVADYLPEVGSGPAVPRGVGYVLLAGPIDTARWGIFMCSDAVEFSERVRPIPVEVVQILESGRRYPPALALARDNADAVGALLREPEFVHLYADLVELQLKTQEGKPYVLVKAANDEPGYLISGQYYWVLEYAPGTSSVRWVSDDYHVYQNPASDFALSDDQLRQLQQSSPAV